MLKAKRVAQFCQTYPVMPGCEELRQCPPGGCLNGQCLFGYCNCNPGWGGPNCMDLLGVPVAIEAPHYIPPMEYQPPAIVTMPPWWWVRRPLQGLRRARTPTCRGLALCPVQHHARLREVRDHALHLGPRRASSREVPAQVQ